MTDEGEVVPRWDVTLEWASRQTGRPELREIPQIFCPSLRLSDIVADMGRQVNIARAGATASEQVQGAASE